MVNKRFYWLFILLSFVSSYALIASAQLGDFSDPFESQPEFLPIEEAFEFNFLQQDERLVVSFKIADGYYLYKKQFKTVVKNAELGEPEFPKAQQIEDEFFGISDVFYGDLSISYPIINAAEDAEVGLRYQGCAEAGLCYPPSIHKIYLSDSAEASEAPSSQAPSKTSAASSQYELAEDLASNEGMLLTLLGFLGLGALLAFTPCVFPMYPILSGIVIGQGKDVKVGRAFWLSFVYVQGMAITYSILGVIVASAGVQFQAALQHPLLLSIFIVLFVVLSLAMFGAYELQLPSSWQERMNNMSNNQQRGNFVGVFVMGILSGLVASPCTTAPLTAILLYIAQNGDLFLGFIALYVLSIGMGIPLIVFGVTGGKLLPKAGAWMNIIKVTFGFMMLAVAILFVERMWISDYSLLLYSALGLAAFSYYFVMNSGSTMGFMKGVRTLVIFLGLFSSAMVGYQVVANKLLGHSNLASSAPLQSTETENGHPKFIQITDLQDFKAKLAQANAQGKSVMVDLYADWCVACKEFESRTFPNPLVVEALSNTVWMQIDLTDTSDTNFEFQDHFDVLGLPTILFFDEDGDEVNQSRITGFMKAEPFAAHIQNIL